MSKKTENIDQLFQSELGSFSKKAPASVKLNVNKAIGFRSSKLIWLLGSTSVLLVSLLTIYLYFDANNTSEDLLGKNELPISDTNIFPNDSENEINQTLNPNEIEVSEKTIIKDQKLNTNNISNNQLVQKTNSNSNLFINSKTGNLSRFGNKEIVDPQQKDIHSDMIVNKITKEKDDSDLVKTIKDEKLILNINDDILLENKNELAFNKDKKEVFQAKKDTIITDDLSLHKDSTAKINDVEIIDSSLADPDIDFDEQSNSNTPWFFNISTGINVKKSTFETTITGDEFVYSNQLKDKMGHSALFDVSYRLKNSLTFGAGIGYTALYENYNYYKADVIVIDTNYITSYSLDSIPDTLGGWTYITDSVVSPDYVYGEHEYYNANGTNSNTYLNIPIRFGTQLIFSKWRLDLFVGGRFNLLIASKSTYIENGQLYYTKNQGFKNSYFDLTFGASAHYEIYNSLFLSGTVRYRPPLNSAYYSSQITNRFQNTYIGIGIGFSL